MCCLPYWSWFGWIPTDKKDSCHLPKPLQQQEKLVFQITTLNEYAHLSVLSFNHSFSLFFPFAIINQLKNSASCNFECCFCNSWRKIQMFAGDTIGGTLSWYSIWIAGVWCKLHWSRNSSGQFIEEQNLWCIVTLYVHFGKGIQLYTHTIRSYVYTTFVCLIY